MTDRLRIAVVDDERAQRQLLDNALRRAGYDTILCKDGEAALVAAPECALMLLDVRMPGMSGLDVLDKLRDEHPGLPVILLTAFIDVRDAVAAIKAGALDYLEKPVDLDELIAAIDDALGQTGRPVSEGALELPEGVVGESVAMRRVFEQAARVAESEVTVLLDGESGVGKEVVAEFIHARSGRSGTPMVRVDCAALPEHLIESALFGHEKGAFTGADVQREGRFQAADGGTLFLDEVGELPLAVQPKFLRVLERGTFHRIGGNEEIRVDVRLIAATNRTLDEEVRKGTFREDLFYRLNVITISIPPLRDRGDDVLLLARHFAAEYAREWGKPPVSFSDKALQVLKSYDWPGNVRELQNVVQRLVVMADSDLIDVPHLPSLMRFSALRDTELHRTLAEVETTHIRNVLTSVNGNKTRAAEILGIDRKTLRLKLQRT